MTISAQDMIMSGVLSEDYNEKLASVKVSLWIGLDRLLAVL